MKITRKQLRRLIMETMITPSTSIIKQILDDTEVDEKIKAILRSDDEERINQALNLMSVLYPDKYGTIDTDIGGYTSTTDYETEFNKIKADQILLTAPSAFKDWLKQSLTDLPDDFVEIFEASLAYYFDGYANHFGLYNTVTDHMLFDEYFQHTYPLHDMIIAHYIDDVKGITYDNKFYDLVYDRLQTVLKEVDLEPGVIEALSRLRDEDYIFYDDDNYLYIFDEAQTRRWYDSHDPKYDKY